MGLCERGNRGKNESKEVTCCFDVKRRNEQTDAERQRQAERDKAGERDKQR